MESVWLCLCLSLIGRQEGPRAKGTSSTGGKREDIERRVIRCKFSNNVFYLLQLERASAVSETGLSSHPGSTLWENPVILDVTLWVMMLLFDVYYESGKYISTTSLTPCDRWQKHVFITHCSSAAEVLIYYQWSQICFRYDIHSAPVSMTSNMGYVTVIKMSTPSMYIYICGLTRPVRSQMLCQKKTFSSWTIRTELLNVLNANQNVNVTQPVYIFIMFTCI